MQAMVQPTRPSERKFPWAFPLIRRTMLIMLQREQLLARIWIDPKRCFGKPCIRGHRIWVSLILDLLASGMTTPEILAEYPGLEPADIQACVAYGSEMSRVRYVDIPLESSK